MQEPQTRLTLEAPGGLIEVVADCRDGKAERIHVQNVPSFADRLDAPLEVDGLGTLKVDIAYGGDSFVIVDAAGARLCDPPDEARDLAETGHQDRRGGQRAARLCPSGQRRLGPYLVLPVRRAAGARGTARSRGPNAVVVRPGKIDRSPTGTGCSARMATLRARGLLQARRPLSRPLDHRLDFVCHVARKTTVAGRPAIVPVISGRAWITGVHQHMLDPTDPWPAGYRLADTWPRLTPKSRT